ASSWAPTRRRRTRAGSSSCGWPSSSGRRLAAPANRGRGTASPRGSSTTPSGAWCSRCCSPSFTAPAWWATRPHSGSGIRSFAPVLITASWVPIEALLIASLQQTPGKWLFGVYLQFSISDAYARRDVRAQLRRALRRGFRVWWEGIGCGFPLFAPILIAVAYEKGAQNGETDWDFAEDCLVTHSPPGALNIVTGVVGLAAMLWLYGVAWHEPMTESIAMAKSAEVSWVPSPPSLLSYGLQGDVGKISSVDRSAAAPAPTLAPAP